MNYKKINMKATLLIITLLLSSCSNYIKIEPSGDRSSTDHFVSSNDDAAKAAGLPILRELPLDDDLTEIRIWVGFGPLILQDVYRIYKTADGTVNGAFIWHFNSDFGLWDQSEIDEFYKETYTDCKPIGQFNDTKACEVTYYKETDWQQIFNDLEKIDIWNIPDESEVPKLQHKDIIATLDGSHVVVELKKKGLYRSFSHRLSPAPKIRKNRYGHKIMEILSKEIK